MPRSAASFTLALLSALAAIIILAGAFLIATCDDDWCYIFSWQKTRAADSFERCASLGFPVAESYPRQCRAGGKTFVENVPPPLPVSAQHEKIRVTEPKAGSVVTSPLRVSGEARGTWYFEASFPVKLLDANGRELAVFPAQAKGEWMTENFVPFEVMLEWSRVDTPTGVLVLEKDNPSGLPEYADELRIPVRFE